MADAERCDVAIVGGGPAGSTVAGLLKIYDPALRVMVLEKEVFPREHVGESQLPAINAILDELGVWERVEAAGFPIKIGASYTWGQNADQWDFDLYPLEKYVETPRPATLDAQRRSTTFQVERAIYDTILLDRAAELGCDVRQGTRVARVHTSGDRVDALELDGGVRVEAEDYVDASGTVGLLRRALGVHSEAPKALRNIAIWDYWEGVPWAVAIGNATRVQVRSIGYGWLWYIPLSETKASCGLVCPSDYYKSRGVSPEELYLEAIAKEPRISELTAKGTRSGNIQTTKDWSHLADRLVGENWWLAGESAGFADPILAAGMTLAHHSARDVACTLLEQRRGRLDVQWLKDSYNDRTRGSIRQHIQFAQYWYAANGCFTDLQDHCVEIAREAGLELNPKQAWAWLAQGGFTNTNALLPFFGSYDLTAARRVLELFAGEEHKYTFHQYNSLRPDIAGAVPSSIPHYERGEVKKIDGLRRGQYFVPYGGNHGFWMQQVTQEHDINNLFARMQHHVQTSIPERHRTIARNKLIQTLETLVLEGWVKGEVNPQRPMLQWEYLPSKQIRWATESDEALRRRNQTLTSN